MNSNQNEGSAKDMAKRALTLNKVKPDATPVPKTFSDKKVQPPQKPRG